MGEYIEERKVLLIEGETTRALHVLCDSFRSLWESLTSVKKTNRSVMGKQLNQSSNEACLIPKMVTDCSFAFT